MKARDFINQYVLTSSSRLTKSVSKEALAQFLQSVGPVMTEHPLIRVGGDADGGYLLADDLDGIQTCFSPGVAVTSDFEDALAKRGIRSFMADYSVDGPPTQNPLFHFEKKYLGAYNDSIFTTLQAWVERNAPQEQDMVLQMDIEGAEYPVLLSTPDEILKRFRTIVVEFHGLGGLAEKNGFELISLSFGKLLAHFDVVHAHVNNCTAVLNYQGLDLPPVMEFTFHRKDRSTQRKAATVFPHPLDRANLPVRSDKVLPACWQAKSMN